MKKLGLILVMLVILLTGCTETIVEVKEVEVTRIVEVEVTRIVEVEVTRIVTATFTPTPLFTPTITLTPTNTSTPTNTPTITSTPNVVQTEQAREWVRLTRDRGSGFYLVNVDIAPGIWRSTPGLDGCYWKVSSATGDIIANHFGMSGGTAYIPSTAFQVQFDDCGIWTFTRVR